MLPDRPYPAPFDTSTFIIPAEWHAFSDLLGGAETGLLVLRDGRIIHLNTHLLEQLGYDEDKLIGQPVESLFPKGNGGPPSNITNGSVIRLLDKDGAVLDFEVLANRIDSITDARCTIWVMHPLQADGNRPPSDEDHVRMHAVAAEKKRQLHYFNRLFRIAQRPHPNIGSALKLILKASAKALGVHRCAYWEAGDTPAAVRCVTAYDDIRQNFIDETPDAPQSAVLQPLMQQVLRDECVLVASDVDLDPRTALYCEYFHPNAIKAVMMAPVSRGGKTDGLVVFTQFNEARHWHKDDAEFAGNVALLVSRVFHEAEHGKMKSQLRQLSFRDSLTGLPDREFLAGHATALFPSPGTASTLAAFLVDLDGFRNINAAFSHDIGDELLKATALRLKSIVRKDDLLAHFGGDKFFLLACDLTGMRVADDIAQQVLDTLRGTFSLQGRELQISASVGIALYPGGGSDIDALMKSAEIALRHAKSAGGDRYRMFAPAQNGRNAPSGAQA
jgi:diguanylate cyclase (GGDEF)-like protein